MSEKTQAGARGRRRDKRRGQSRRQGNARRKQTEPPRSEPQVVGDLALALAEARLQTQEAPGEPRPSERQQSEAMLSKLRVFEGELVDAGAELERIKQAMDAGAARKAPDKGRKGRRRLARSDGLTRDRMPDGAILVATRLAREGRSRDEVKTFLRESFSGVDLSSVIKLAFSDDAVSD